MIILGEENLLNVLLLIARYEVSHFLLKFYHLLVLGSTPFHTLLISFLSLHLSNWVNPHTFTSSILYLMGNAGLITTPI